MACLYYQMFLFGPVPKSLQHTNEISNTTNLEMYTRVERVLPSKGKLCSLKLAVSVTFLTASIVLQRLRVHLRSLTDSPSNPVLPTDTLKHTLLP